MARELAARLASGPWQGYSRDQGLLSRELDMGLAGAVELEAMTQALLMKGDDYREFHAAFTGEARPALDRPLTCRARRSSSPPSSADSSSTSPTSRGAISYRSSRVARRVRSTVSW